MTFNAIEHDDILLLVAAEILMKPKVKKKERSNSNRTPMKATKKPKKSKKDPIDKD